MLSGDRAGLEPLLGEVLDDRPRGPGLYGEVHVDRGSDCDRSPKSASRSLGCVIGAERDGDRDSPDHYNIIDDRREYGGGLAHEWSWLDDFHQPSLPRTAAAPSSARSPSL